MVTHEPSAAATRGSGWRRAAIVVVAVLAALVLLVVFFPWNAARGPIGRYVSDKTGRHFAITRNLSVSLGRTTRVRAEGVEFANPSWASDPWLLRSDVVDLQVRLWPLLHGQLVLPSLSLQHAESGLQELPDGRKTWDLTKPGSKPSAKSQLPAIGRLAVDDGRLHYLAPAQRIDVQAQLSMQPDPGNASKALAVQADGRFRDQPFHATGHAGDVLQIVQGLQKPFPAEVRIEAANTRMHVVGTVAQLVPLGGITADVDVQGRSLADLYHVTGVVLPETPSYKLQAHVSDEGTTWKASGIKALLGKSDLTGELAFDNSQAVPLLSGKVESQRVDFVDLGPLIGLDDKPRPDTPKPPPNRDAKASAKQASAAAPGKVLPDKSLDLDRLRKMNADVQYTAVHIVNLNTIPVDQGKLHVRLHDGLLDIDPMDLGFAGGRLAGRVRIDASKDPAASALKLSMRNVALPKLVSGSSFEKYLSLGTVQADIDLHMRGNSTARMLATSDGTVAAVMGGAHMSKLASQAASLHVGEVLGLLLTGDKEIDVRCAAAAFDVRRGLMQSRALVFDTSDTALYGDGSVNLASENLDLIVRQYPKEKSLLSLRSPIRVDGPFRKPDVHLDKTALATKGGASVALAAVTPLLALAATFEKGGGKDADCGSVLREAAGVKGGAEGMAGAAAQAARSEAQQPGGKEAMGAGPNPEEKPGLLARMKKALGF
ncbi:AsmA family protein [Ramlibacter sp. MMS24-I3-19]|uniref:AsmA family protein n=1 Tax=Ramlibacter sp. MMS24-I3-19 TaxID=3416606 RepID=UPI003D006BCB